MIDEAAPPAEPSAQAEHDAHLSRRSMRVRVVRDVFEIIAFSAAGIWAIWTFWYQARYEPAHAKPLVEWSLTLEREAVRPSDGMLAIRARVRGVNKGKATLKLASVNVTIAGSHVVRTPPSERQRNPEPLDPDAGDWQRELGARREREVPLASQGFRWGGNSASLIDPDQEHTEDLLFWVDPADYDFLIGSLVVRPAPDPNFERGWFQPVVDDAGVVSVQTTAACKAAAPRCYSGAYETGTELPLWPAAVDASRSLDAGVP